MKVVNDPKQQKLSSSILPGQAVLASFSENLNNSQKMVCCQLFVWLIIILFSK